MPATRRWSSNASPTCRCRSVRAEPREHGVVVGRLGEDVGTEASRDSAVELEHGAVEHRADVLVAAQDEPRPAEDRRVAAQHEPASLHAQVAAQDEPALEAEQEVLADRLDVLEPKAVQARRELLHGGARMRRLDLELSVRRAPAGDERRDEGRPLRACSKGMSPRLRAAAAGAVAAVVWGLQEPLDRRVFGCDYSDVLFLGRGRRSVGFVVHMR